MTPSQLEHLRKIDAHLERLLDIASKRTPGEWLHQVSSSDPNRSLVNLRHANGVLATFATRSGDLNLEFTSACAGNAEAGWKATRAAINQGMWLMEMDQQGRLSLQDQGTTHQMLLDILAAFPLETLNPKQP